MSTFSAIIPCYHDEAKLADLQGTPIPDSVQVDQEIRGSGSARLQAGSPGSRGSETFRPRVGFR